MGVKIARFSRLTPHLLKVSTAGLRARLINHSFDPLLSGATFPHFAPAMALHKPSRQLEWVSLSHGCQQARGSAGGVDSMLLGQHTARPHTFQWEIIYSRQPYTIRKIAFIKWVALLPRLHGSLLCDCFFQRPGHDPACPEKMFTLTATAAARRRPLSSSSSIPKMFINVVEHTIRPLCFAGQIHDVSPRS